MLRRSTRAPAHRFAVRARDEEEDMYEASEAESLPEYEGMAEVASDGVAYQRAQLTPTTNRHPPCSSFILPLGSMSCRIAMLVRSLEQ